MDSIPHTTLNELSVTGGTVDGFVDQGNGLSGNGGEAPGNPQGWMSQTYANWMRQEWAETGMAIGDHSPGGSTAKSVVLPIIKSKQPSNNQFAIDQAAFRRDDNGNLYYTLTTAKTVVTPQNVAQLYGLDLSNPQGHQYTIDTNICFVSNPDCTIANVFQALKRHPAPFVYYNNGVESGQSSNVPGLGRVEHDVDIDTKSVINITLNGHELFPGVVYQTLYQDGQTIGIRTIGVGTGSYRWVNEKMSGLVWTEQGLVIQQEVLGLSKSQFFAPTTWDSYNPTYNIKPSPNPIDTPLVQHDTTIFPSNFDSFEYLASNPGLAQALGSFDPLTAASHYSNHGKSEGRQTNSFDSSAYEHSNQDVAVYYGSDTFGARDHYIRYGYAESRDNGSGHTVHGSVPNLVSGDPVWAVSAAAHLYRGLLHRDPEINGLSSAVNLIKNGASTNYISGSFMGSEEFRIVDTHYSDAQYLTHVYESILHRSPDAAGFNYLLHNWEHAGDRTAEANFALDSNEFQSRTQSMSTGSYVSELYQDILGRTPSAGEVQAWSSNINSGSYNRSTAAHAFVNSAEFQEHYVQSSNAAFVDSVYIGALGRHADAGGLNQYVGWLSGGASRAEIANIISQSAEAQIHLSDATSGWHLIS